MTRAFVIIGVACIAIACVFAAGAYWASQSDLRDRIKTLETVEGLEDDAKNNSDADLIDDLSGVR